MKKMLRFVATLICVMMAIASFTACTAGTGNNKPTEEPSKPTEEVVTTTPTVEPTEEPTVEPTEPTVEPTTEPAAEAEIIPLWNTTSVEVTGMTINQILSETPPADWFTTEFLTGIARYWPFAATDRKVNGNLLYQLDTSVRVQNIVLCDPWTENSDRNVVIYFIAYPDNSVSTYFDADGSTATLQFLPLYYNTGKKCLVGYWINSGATTLVECYWNADTDSYFCIDPEDPSLYGL